MRRCACRHREARACMRAATHTLHSPHARRACARAARHVAHKCSSCGRHRRSPLRPRSTHTPAMPSDATGGWPCLHPPCVSSRAHHRAHYSAQGHLQQRAYMRALADVYIRNIAYAHSTSLTRSRSAHLCARAHMHMHTARQTASHRHTGYPRHRHPLSHHRERIEDGCRAFRFWVNYYYNHYNRNRRQTGRVSRPHVCN